jgi:hypothetical protein
MNIESAPAPYLGAAAIRANDPSRANKLVLHHHTVSMKTCDNGTPKKPHTRSFRVLDQDAMKIDAPDSET